MNEHSTTTAAEGPSKFSRWTKAAIVFFAIVGAYVVFAYLLMPLLWHRYVHKHPALDEVPGITVTHDGHPGDPLNVALIGSEEDLQQIMLAAGWYPADPITLKSSLKIAAGTVLKRSYDEAPVSPLFLFGRKQDLAFEQPVGDNPRKRHHVRFWKCPKPEADGRAAWVGSATYDERVGLSHTTGQITHHISGDVDAERDHLFENLKATKDLIAFEVIAGFHKVLTGRNGGGDEWHTDGSLYLGTIKKF